MDITQLWSHDPGHAQPVLTSQVQPAEELDCRDGRQNEVVLEKSEKPNCNSGLESMNSQHEIKRSLHTDNQGFSSQGEESASRPTEKLGSKDHASDFVKEDLSELGSRHVSVATPEELPEADQRASGGREARADPMDESSGSQSGEDWVRESSHRATLPGSLPGSRLDGLVHQPLREVEQAKPQEVCQVRGNYA